MRKKRYFIKGASIYLRNVVLDDVDGDYYKWMNDPEVNQYMETRFSPQSMDDIRRYVTRMVDKEDEIFLAICRKADDKHIGNIKLGPINPFHRFGSISLFIGEKKYWGKGIASEAISLVKDLAFERLKLHKLTAGCYANNPGSILAFEKAGFRRECVEKEKWLFNGRYIDGFIMACLKNA